MRLTDGWAWRHFSCAFIVGLLASQAVAATVWKCQEGERVVFSDAPCPSTGKPVDPRRLQPNIVKAEPVTRAVNQEREVGAGYANAGAEGAGRACPSDLEIRNMEVSAGSVTRSKEDKAFLRDEVRRARQCQKGQGNYSANDWQISRDAQRDQGSVDPRRGKEARTRAEGMHSAADPIEGDRIAERRRQEEYLREQRRIAAQLAAQAAASRAAEQNLPWNCDQRGCTNSAGERYFRKGNTDTYIGPVGTCRRVGHQLLCP